MQRLVVATPVSPPGAAPRGWIAAALALLIALGTLPARAQDSEETLDEAVSPRANIVGEAGYVWQGDADIDGGGSVEVNRFDVGLLGRFDVVDRLRSINSFFFSVNSYDFDDGGLSAADPWGTILTMRLASQLRYAIDDHWGISGGGVFMFAPESDADWGDSFTGGGMIGGDYRHSDTLFVSLGVAVISEIEDDVQVTPSVILNWQPHEQWAVRVGAVPATGGTAAAGEVAYRIAEPVELGLGVLFNQRRFRLDDSGPAPEGVGEDNTLPVRLRLGWHVTPQISLHLLGGVALAGELQLDDRNGNRIAREDYDPAPYVGARFIGAF